mmetsp:Transcript_9161/g.37760  ORF Transcript_9161/g.37760 Transcript_9161/m.37760 type:complete len:220 (-) Transcript_9161:1579-2238(-)
MAAERKRLQRAPAANSARESLSCRALSRRRRPLREEMASLPSFVVDSTARQRVLWMRRRSSGELRSCRRRRAASPSPSRRALAKEEWKGEVKSSATTAALYCSDGACSWPSSRTTAGARPASRNARLFFSDTSACARQRRACSTTYCSSARSARTSGRTPPSSRSAFRFLSVATRLVRQQRESMMMWLSEKEATISTRRLMTRMSLSIAGRTHLCFERM